MLLLLFLATLGCVECTTQTIIDQGGKVLSCEICRDTNGHETFTCREK
jgi:hypothetical protein